MGLIFVLLTSVLFIQGIASQTIGNRLNPAPNFNGLPNRNFANPATLGVPSAGYPAPGCGAVAATGGGFAVTSTSPIAPTGVSVLAENLAIEGPLSVGGQLPFLGTIGVEGALPAIGSGAVSYGCGSGNIGVTSEGLLGGGVPGPYGLAGQVNSPGLGSSSYGLAGPGFAANAFGSGLAGQGFGPGFSVSLPNPGLGYSGVSGISAGAVL